MWSSRAVLAPSYPVALSQPPWSHWLTAWLPGILSPTTTLVHTLLLQVVRIPCLICRPLRQTLESGPRLGLGLPACLSLQEGPRPGILRLKVVMVMHHPLSASSICSK